VLGSRPLVSLPCHLAPFASCPPICPSEPLFCLLQSLLRFAVAPSTADNSFLLFNYNSWGIAVMEDEVGG